MFIELLKGFKMYSNVFEINELRSVQQKYNV